nr:dienelactone hydrolase family protein [Coraliomargarita akajimensis]
MSLPQFDIGPNTDSIQAMLRTTILAILFVAHSLTLSAEWITEQVPYQLNGTQFEGQLIYQASKQSLPAILMVPNWMGPTENATQKAKMIAQKGFAVFIADMYGIDIRPQNTQESAAAAGSVRADRPLMRARAQKAVDVLHQLADKHPINPDKTLSIGFCFGGGTVLELARSGTDSVQGVISFHGNLDTPNPSDAEQIKVPVLVLHGADDPYVPKAQIDDFFAEMQGAQVDFQFIAFGGAVHSFTNPEAQSEGARYHERSAKRSFAIMDDFAAEVLDL